MAEITAEMVRLLREETGAGMMDCKKALTEAGGDMAEARVIIRKKGQDKAVSKAGRTASEGVIESYITEPGDVGVLLELNCETDFVARSVGFRSLAAQLARLIAASPDAGGPAGVDALLTSPIGTESKQTVGEYIIEAAVPIGEKVALTRFARYDVGSEAQAVGAYIHRTDYKTGVMVEVAADRPVGDNSPLVEVAREIALHIAAAKPAYVSREDVPKDLIDQEREIATAKAKSDPKFESKPDAAKTAMVEGQVRKFLEQTVLLDQAFVRDPSGKQRVGHLVEAAGKSAGAGLRVVRFALYRVGAIRQSEESSAA